MRVRVKVASLSPNTFSKFLSNLYFTFSLLSLLDLSDSESDNEDPESCLQGPSVLCTESSKQSKRRLAASRSEEGRSNSDTILTDVPRNSSMSSTSTSSSSSSSSRESARSSDNKQRPPLTTPLGPTVKYSLKKIMSKHNISVTVSSPSPTSGSGPGKSKGKLAPRPSDLEKGGVSVLLMSQQLSLKGNTATFLNRFTATQVSLHLAILDFYPPLFSSPLYQPP